jgi:hypothetical protein
MILRSLAKLVSRSSSRQARTVATALIILLSFLFLASLPLASSNRSVIKSTWINSPPNIDGKFTPNEWTNPQMVFQVPPYPKDYLNASVYFANDASKLYVMVDAIGDKTDDAFDETLLAFNFPLKNQTLIAFWGYAGQGCIPSESGPNCIIPKGVLGVIGFGVSLNSGETHKIYEMSIPLQLIRAAAGESLDFCSPKVGARKASIAFDYLTHRDNVWPATLTVSDRETWGILVLAGLPVPEFSIATVATVSVFMLICLMLVRKKRRDALPSR